MINNLFLDLSLLFTKNQTTKKFIRHNYKNFKNKTNNRSKNIVLIEFSGWSFHHIINSYLSNFWSKKYSAKIHAYPGYVLNRYTLNFLGKIKFIASNLFPIKNFLIYKSFGVSKFFYPQLSNVEKDKAFKIYQQKIKVIKSRKSILNLKIDNVLIGDLIYDSYLKFYRIPTLNINDENLKNFLLESIKSFIFWNNYLNNNKIKAIILTHAVYSGAMLMRIALHKYKDIKVCSAGALGVYNFSKNKINPWLDFKSLRKEFNSLKPSIKSIALKNSKIRIIPEGGTEPLAIKGCEEILQKEDINFDVVCSSVGTGGTLSGLINSVAHHQKVIGFNALKNPKINLIVSNFTKISANFITFFGAFLALIAVYFVLTQSIFYAAVFFYCSYICDFLDGKIARLRKTSSHFGKKLDLPFIDIDNLIVKDAGMSVAEIFKKKGEGYFRNLEQKITLKSLKNIKNVISLGGGGFINKKIREEILAYHYSFWLNWDESILIKRIKSSKKRPLAFNSTDLKIRKLIKERSKIYSTAQFKINCTELTKTEIIKKILKIYEPN